jgi:hypothetical protein
MWLINCFYRLERNIAAGLCPCLWKVQFSYMGTTDGRKPKGTKDRSILLQGLKNSIWRSENWESPRVAKATWTSSGSWLLRWEMPLALCGWYAWEVSVTVVPLLGMYSSNKVNFWKLQLSTDFYTLFSIILNIILGLAVLCKKARISALS